MSSKLCFHKTTVTCSYPVPSLICHCSHSSWMELAPRSAAHGIELLLSHITITWAVPQFRTFNPGHMCVVAFIHLFSRRASAGCQVIWASLLWEQILETSLSSYGLLVAVSSRISEVHCHIAHLSNSLRVPQCSWGKVYRDSVTILSALIGDLAMVEEETG